MQAKNKYQVTIKDTSFDVYDVITAFNVTCPAKAHAIKKLLKSGQRGYKSEQQDLNESIQAIERAKELLTNFNKENQ